MPSIPEDAYVLSGAIFIALLVATFFAKGLQLLVAKGQPHAVIDNIVLRIHAWWAIAALVGVAFFFGPVGVYLLFGGVALLALREFLTAGGGDWRHLRRLIPGLGICVVGVAFAPALSSLDLPGYTGRGGFLLMFLLLVSQLGDVFQYLWGKLTGRHALAPRVSPSKTVEGLVGGVLSASALGAGLAWMTPFSYGQAAGLALGIALLGVLGGLLLSAEKRRRGIKDWGTLVAGHGGVLDRLDSVYLSAPGFYLAVVWGWR